MKVLVSGATGFVASHLIPALAAAGHDVVGAGHDHARIPAEATVLEFDLAAPDWPALPDVDAVVHLAQANVPFPEGADALFAVNVAATQRLLEHARRTGARRFVLASSGSVYGNVDGAAERGVASGGSGLLLRHEGGCGAPHKGVRRSPGHRDLCASSSRTARDRSRRMLPRLVERIRSGEPIQLNREGRPRMNPIYVDDVVHVMLHALDRAGSVGRAQRRR